VLGVDLLAAINRAIPR